MTETSIKVAKFVAKVAVAELAYYGTFTMLNQMDSKSDDTTLEWVSKMIAKTGLSMGAGLFVCEIAELAAKGYYEVGKAICSTIIE